MPSLPDPPLHVRCRRPGARLRDRATPVIRFRRVRMETLQNMTGVLPIGFAAILLLILIISFRSRAVVFCQYLEAMTGIKLKPSDVRRVYREKGRNGVREMFLDLIIREDLREGPIEIPDEKAV